MANLEIADEAVKRPSFLAVVSVVLLPILLISLAALTPLLFPAESGVVRWSMLMGHPFIALLLAVVLAWIVLGVGLGFGAETLMPPLGRGTGLHRLAHLNYWR